MIIPGPRRRGAQPAGHIFRLIFSIRSPQARGSTGYESAAGSGDVPVPAGAGLNRMNAATTQPHSPGPRRRGAQPLHKWDDFQARIRSPQARGSTGRACQAGLEPVPVPAGAGLNRTSSPSGVTARSGPRRRGAQPITEIKKILFGFRSPQARGSTATLRPNVAGFTPVPAGAGLNQDGLRRFSEAYTGPRRRGAQPSAAWKRRWASPRSPQARGSTAWAAGPLSVQDPVPAGAGLNRSPSPAPRPSRTGPRRRGAQPPCPAAPCRRSARSPQARGSTALVERQRQTQ